MQKTILIIDDEPDVIDVIRAVLKTKGYKLLTANGGEEGLHKAERDRPNLIVLDLMMPRMSGLEVIKRLKKNEKTADIPIIVISAITSDATRTPEFWKRGLGVDEFVEKPFDPLDLLGRVEFIFRRGDYVSTGTPRAVHNPTPAGANLDALATAEPREVVRLFIESRNTQDFATEFGTLGDEMTGGLAGADYVQRRHASWREDASISHRTDTMTAVIDENISEQLARISVERTDSDGTNTRVRKEQYVLKKTQNGWKIVSYRPIRD